MIASSSGVSREEVLRNRRSIKTTQTQNSFFAYLSGDYLKIREFSRKNGVITFSFFIFMRLDSALPERFIQQIQRSLAEPLQKALTPVVESGWRVMDRAQYNRVVALQSFCAALSSVKPEVFSQTPFKIMEALRDIEQWFFVFHGDHTLFSQLEQQLGLFAKMGNLKNFPVDGIIRALQTLFAPNISRLTLYSFFIALNSLCYRRFLGIEDLVVEERRQYIYQDDFDLDEHNRLLLANYVNEVVVAIQRQARNHQEIQLFKAYLPMEARSAFPDTRKLKEFYNYGTGEDRYSPDHMNVLGFLLRFSQKAGIEFSRLLNGDVSLNLDKKARIFDSSVFSTAFTRIGYLRDRLDKETLQVPKLERSRYLRILSEGPSGMQSSEEPVFVHIAELLNIYFQMARTIANVLRHASSTKREGSVPPIRAINWTEIQFFIPHESGKQYSSGYLAGKTVREALASVAQVLLLLCLDLRETELVTIMNKDIHTMDTLKQLIRELARVSTPARYRELHEELKLEEIEEDLA